MPRFYCLISLSAAVQAGGIEDVATILGTLCKAGYSVFSVATPSVARVNVAGSKIRHAALLR